MSAGKKRETRVSSKRVTRGVRKASAGIEGRRCAVCAETLAAVQWELVRNRKVCSQACAGKYYYRRNKRRHQLYEMAMAKKRRPQDERFIFNSPFRNEGATT